MIERLEDQIDKQGRDLVVLQAVIDNGPIGIGRLSEKLDLPEHKVRYSLRMLENDDLIEPSPEGAVPRDDITEQIEGINSDIDGLIKRIEELRELRIAP